MSSFSGSPYSKSAGKVDSGVSQLELKDENGNPKNITNLTSYMDIFIPAKNGFAKPNHHLITMGDMLVLKLNVTNNKSAIYVWAVPEHNNTKTVIFCRKGCKPSTTEYDFRQVVPSDPKESGNETEETGSSDDSFDAQRYQLFLDNDVLNQTASGMWYCGFYYNGSAREFSHRQRRETEDKQEKAPEKNNVSITIFESTCKYYDIVTKKWKYDGCKVIF